MKEKIGIDVSHSYTHRLKGYGALASEQAESLSIRLNKEVAEERLPFFSLDFADELLGILPAYTQKVSHFTDILLLGVGGSSLGTKFLYDAFALKEKKRLWVMDNINPKTFSLQLTTFQVEKLLVLVVSKSGETIETVAQYMLVKQYLQEQLGAAWVKHVIFITDAEKGLLREESRLLGIAALAVPKALGGRYSVFSAVGLLPAALLGIDYKALLLGAKGITDAYTGSGLSLLQHPAYRLALWARDAMFCDYGEFIFFSYVPQWTLLGTWFAQLWAESLGKEGKGSMPIPALGVCDQHSINQMFLAGPRNKICLFLEAERKDKGPCFPLDMPKQFSFLQGRHYGDLLSAEALGTRVALQQSGVPLTHLRLLDSGEASAGELMQLLMFATLLCGWLMDINPLDQEAVELGKRLAYAKLGAEGFLEEKKILENY